MFSTNGGASFTPNLQISAGTSNSHDSGNGIDYGDYNALSFYGVVAHPAWSDNSNSTGNNPDGGLHQLDIYTAAVPGPIGPKNSPTGTGVMVDYRPSRIPRTKATCPAS